MDLPFCRKVILPLSRVYGICSHLPKEGRPPINFPPALPMICIYYFSFCQEDPAMSPIFYTVRAINGDYADLVSDDGLEHSITMFLLPEGTTLGSRLKFEDFQWELV